MATPAWVTRFESEPDSSSPCAIPSTSRNTDSSWSYGDISDTALLPVRHQTSYSADYSDSTGKDIPRIRTIQSSPNCSLADDEKRIKKRRRRRQHDETSGYSTTSLSELSEFETTPKRGERRRSPNDHHLYVAKRHDPIQEDRRVSRVSQTSNRRESEDSKECSSRRVSELSKSSSRPEVTQMGHRVPRARSTADSIGSLHSARSGKSNHTHRSNHSKAHTINSSTTLQRKVISTEQIDPFAFIQPDPDSFSTRLRKTMGPCMGILIMLILAASLGAAIYFAIELKKTHEEEIEMLRANLALKIKNTRYGKTLDELTQSDFKGLALDYCQQMDRFYQRSHFKSTYRGCEVVSIKNEHINFTLFFMEKDATKKEIISVLETAAPKVTDSDQSVALVDKFEIELENAKITIEHRRTPVNFNKISKKPPEKVKKNKDIKPTKNYRGKVRTTTKKPTTTTKPTPKPPTATDLAWTPCAYKSEAFYPHPIACNRYFQCEHGKSLLKTCTGNLLFDVTSAVCVEDRADLICPDADNAPPAPPTTRAPVNKQTSTTTRTPASQNKPFPTEPTPDNSSVTSSVYPSRPAYSRTPCVTGKPGQLFAHPDDCLRFIQCISPTNGVVQKCATDLVYDPEAMTCIFPRNQELMCPDLIPCDGIIRGYFPHPYNCSKYIQCEAGRELIRGCDVGLVWDPVINSCVFRTARSMCPTATKPGSTDDKRK